MARGLKPIAVGVLLSDRFWNHFDHAPKVCIKAEEWEEGRYEFGYLRRRHVVAVFGDCTNRQFGELLLELMRAGPSNIWAYDLTGAKLFDADGDALGLADWVYELLGRAEGLHEQLIEGARARYAAAVAMAAREELDIFDVLKERGGIEAAVTWHANHAAIPDRVRQLFEAPFQESGELAAA